MNIRPRTIASAAPKAIIIRTSFVVGFLTLISDMNRMPIIAMVPIAEAGLRKEQAQELQNRITEKRLESYVGKEIEVLVEEIIAEEEIALGRGYMNAPEVDGAVILHSGLAADGGIRPGDVVRAKVIKRNNIDLEAVDVRLS